ncbi:MAG: hypothetical protein K8R77_08470, partial [Anaerolineaceae bacterium]|nr:hypothetical protein [Anaerolineaceae bacterium]
NPATQFRAVFRTKAGHLSPFLVEKQVKVGCFYRKNALSDKLLEDLMLTHKKVQIVYVADVTELFNERKLLLYEMDVPLGTDFKPAQPDAKIRKPRCLVLFYDECETVDIVLKDGSTTRIRKALWTIKLGMVSDEEFDKAISPPFMKKPDIE